MSKDKENIGYYNARNTAIGAIMKFKDRDLRKYKNKMSSLKKAGGFPLIIANIDLPYDMNILNKVSNEVKTVAEMFQDQAFVGATLDNDQIKTQLSKIDYIRWYPEFKNGGVKNRLKKAQQISHYDVQHVGPKQIIVKPNQDYFVREDTVKHILYNLDMVDRLDYHNLRILEIIHESLRTRF